MAQITTFLDIVTAVREALGINSQDTNAINKIKRQVNMYYLDEVIPFKRWQWLEKNTQIVHKAYYSQDTASVTPNSTAVTLSSAPHVSLGSFLNYRFAVDGSNAVYTVSAHTAGATAVTLSTAYQEALNAVAEFKIWRDRVDLPTATKETTEIWHAEQPKPLKAVGSQDFRKLEAADPKGEGFPSFYNTWDFYDPSSGSGEAESDRYRQTRIYPSITATPITLNVDYIEEVVALDDDADEPVLPIGDRIVIYYGAVAESYSILNRNEEMAERWRLKANAKLARMAGEREDGMDTPALSPRAGYMNHIRRSGLRRSFVDMVGLGGQSSVALPTYARDITLEGGTITDDFTVNAGVTIDGRDISADGALLDSIAGLTTAVLADNTTNGVVATWALATKNTVHIRYSLTRGTDRRAGQVMITGLGVTAAISEGGIAELSDPGVTFTTDIAGGNLRLIYTTTSTGNTASMVYQALAWLG